MPMKTKFGFLPHTQLIWDSFEIGLKMGPILERLSISAMELSSSSANIFLKSPHIGDTHMIYHLSQLNNPPSEY